MGGITLNVQAKGSLTHLTARVILALAVNFFIFSFPSFFFLSLPSSLHTYSAPVPWQAYIELMLPWLQGGF